MHLSPSSVVVVTDAAVGSRGSCVTLAYMYKDSRCRTRMSVSQSMMSRRTSAATATAAAQTQ